MIYVDDLLPCVPNHRWRWRESCHLFCDGDLAELHRFAARLGLRRSWFQDGGQWRGLPHYDLTDRKRAQALVLGATPADRQTTGHWIRWWRQRRMQSSTSIHP